MAWRLGPPHQGYDLQLTRYDVRGWRATFYTSGMEQWSPPRPRLRGSTLAQTCAALAAFVGAVGIYRLQLLRADPNTIERNVRGLAAQTSLVGADVAALVPST